MTQGDTQHTLDVHADFACIARPELSVERWSYPCPTPSAARGIFDSVYFKPQFYWQVTRIELLAEPSYIALRRNEVGSTAPSDRTIASWQKGTAEPKPLLADTPEQRQQRQTMALRNPRFRLTARVVPRPGQEAQHRAFDEQFRRRARQGKCFQQPYLGAREWVAYFRLVEDLADEPPPIDYSQDIGWMLYDVFDLSKANDASAKPSISVFRAEISNGVLDVPPFESDDVRKPEPRGRRAS